MSLIIGRSVTPRILGSVGRFSLLVVHVDSGFLEEGIEYLGWFDAYGLSEFRAREDSPLEQVSLHVIVTGDLDGLPIAPVNKFPQGLMVSWDDGLEG